MSGQALVLILNIGFSSLPSQICNSEVAKPGGCMIYCLSVCLLTGDLLATSYQSSGSSVEKSQRVGLSSPQDLKQTQI